MIIRLGNDDGAHLMRNGMIKSFIGFWTLLCFAAVGSCHLLCAAQAGDCPLCPSHSHSCCDEGTPCNSCEESQKVSENSQPSKPTEIALLIKLPLDCLPFRHEPDFSISEADLSTEEAYQEAPQNRLLESLKTSAPIRGPPMGI